MANPMSCKFLSSQFQRKCLSYDLDNPALLATPQCQRYQTFYIFYRCLWVLWWLAVTIIDVYISLKYRYTMWFFYLTTYGYLLMGVRSTLQLFLAVHYLHHSNKMIAGILLGLYKFTWVLYELSSAYAFTITILYWSVGFREGTFVSISVHGINSVNAFTDAFISATPVRLLHFWVAVLFGVTYVIYSVISQVMADLEPPYPIMDWTNDPFQTSGISAAAIFIVFSCHVLLFFLYWIRLLVYNGLTGQNLYKQMEGENFYTDKDEYTDIDMMTTGE